MPPTVSPWGWGSLARIEAAARAEGVGVAGAGRAARRRRALRRGRRDPAGRAASSSCCADGDDGVAADERPRLRRALGPAVRVDPEPGGRARESHRGAGSGFGRDRGFGVRRERTDAARPLAGRRAPLRRSRRRRGGPAGGSAVARSGPAVPARRRFVQRHVLRRRHGGAARATPAPWPSRGGTAGTSPGMRGIADCYDDSREAAAGDAGPGTGYRPGSSSVPSASRLYGYDDDKNKAGFRRINGVEPRTASRSMTSRPGWATASRDRGSRTSRMYGSNGPRVQIFESRVLLGLFNLGPNRKQARSRRVPVRAPRLLHLAAGAAEGLRAGDAGSPRDVSARWAPRMRHESLVGVGGGSPGLQDNRGSARAHPSGRRDTTDGASHPGRRRGMPRGPAGDAVEYGMAATDDFDRAPSDWLQRHASGSLLPISTTKVSCTTTDGQGCNSVTASIRCGRFAGPTDQLADFEGFVAAATELGNRDRRFVRFALLSSLTSRSGRVRLARLVRRRVATRTRTRTGRSRARTRPRGSWAAEHDRDGDRVRRSRAGPTPDDAAAPASARPRIATSPPAPRRTAAPRGHDADRAAAPATASGARAAVVAA